MDITQHELERVAQAAGYKVIWRWKLKCFVHEEPFSITNPPTMAGQRLPWVPLTDDGDALRLAVALGLRVCISLENGGCTIVYGDAPSANGVSVMENHGDEPMAATRLAIVLCAIETAAVR